MPRESSRLGLPGDRENIVKLEADHGGVCKFGTTQTDQDNFELVRSNLNDMYQNALKIGELWSIPDATGQSAAPTDEDILQQRLARLRGPA